MRKYTVSLQGHVYPVALLQRAGPHMILEIDGEVHEVSIQTSQSSRDRKNPIAKPSPLPSAKSLPIGGGPDLVAPMPGIVVSLACAVGDSVTAGSVLLVIEAMKMENNLSSHRDGVIREIFVAPGQEVNSGQILIRFEEAAQGE